MGIKILKDNFVWKTLDFIKAEALFKAGLPLYALHSDDSESLIEDAEKLPELCTKGEVGLQVGYIPTALNTKTLYYTIAPELQTLDPNNGTAETTGRVNIVVYKSIRGTLTKVKSMQIRKSDPHEEAVRDGFGDEYQEHKLIIL